MCFAWHENRREKTHNLCKPKPGQVNKFGTTKTKMKPKRLTNAMLISKCTETIAYPMQKRTRSMRNFAASDGFADLLHLETMHTGALPRLAAPRCVIPPHTGPEAHAKYEKLRGIRRGRRPASSRNDAYRSAFATSCTSLRNSTTCLPPRVGGTNTTGRAARLQMMRKHFPTAASVDKRCS